MANELKHGSVGSQLSQTEWEAVGAHVFNSQATGDIVYASSSTQLTRLGIGSTGAVLTVTGGIPAWDTTWTPTGHLIPASDDSYDLGSSAAAWQDLFLEGDITLTDAGTLATSAGALTITSAAATTWSTGAGALTITSAAALNLNPTAGSAIVLDGTINVDAGVVTGATSITSTAFVGDITGNVTGNASGTAATVTTAAQTNITSLGTLTTLTVDNIIINGTNIGHTSDTDSIAIASDGVVTMNQIPVFSAGINVSGGSIAGTLSTAAQTNITSLGTLTALTVDDVAVNGKVVTMTGSASDTAVFTAGTNGTLSIVTTDAAAAAANIQITADGTVDIDSAGVLTLDSGAAINIEPASGSAILLDGTISIDAGVVTGATSITSTAFVGTLSTAAQANVTSLGTLTTLTVDNVIVNGTTIGHTSDTDLLTLTSANLAVAGDLEVSGSVEVATIDFTDGDNALTIADGGGVTFAQDITTTSHKYINLPENSSIKFTDQIGVDNSIDNDDGQGIIFTFRAGATVTPFSPVYLDGNNEAQECDADAIATMPCIGVSMNTSNVSADADLEVMILGLIRHDSFGDFGAAGAPVYVSTTVGTMTTTAPTGEDDVVQIVGHSIAEDLIFVQPCLTTIEHAA